MIRSPLCTRTLRDTPSGERYCSVERKKRLDRVTSTIRTQPISPPNHFGSSMGRGDAPRRTLAKSPIRLKSFIPQLHQKSVELGCRPVSVGKNLLRGDGILLPEVFHGGDEDPLVLPQVAVELLGQEPLESLQDQPLGIVLGNLGPSGGDHLVLLLFHFPDVRLELLELTFQGCVAAKLLVDLLYALPLG